MDFVKSEDGVDFIHPCIQIKTENYFSEEVEDFIEAGDSKHVLPPPTHISNCANNRGSHEESGPQDNLCIVKVEEETVQINTVTPYTCEMCNATYDGLASYEVHLEEKHGHEKDVKCEMLQEQKLTTVLPLMTPEIRATTNAAPIYSLGKELLGYLIPLSGGWDLPQPPPEVPERRTHEQRIQARQLTYTRCNNGGKETPEAAVGDPVIPNHPQSDQRIGQYAPNWLGPYMIRDLFTGARCNVDRDGSVSQLHIDGTKPAQPPSDMLNTTPITGEKSDENTSGFATSHMKTNKMIHTEEKPYKCDECTSSFNRKSHLKTHKLIHSDDCPYKCDECPLNFPTLRQLKTHKMRHTGERLYKCDECTLTFNNKGNLSRHKMIHTGERPYKCDECTSDFTTLYHLKAHKMIHSDECPYKCDECTSNFSTSSQLKTHKMKHTGERPYKCDICTSSYITKSYLKKHKMIHNSERQRPYKCDECTSAFTTPYHFKKHKMIHTGERPHKCDKCNARFTYPSGLKAHALSHTKDKSYKCDECSSSFTNRDHLKQQKIIQTGKGRYKCIECTASFIRRADSGKPRMILPAVKH